MPYEDSLRELPPPTVAKTLFSPDIGGFVEDTGDGYDIAFWLPWWLVFLISLLPIVALYTKGPNKTAMDKPDPALS